MDRECSSVFIPAIRNSGSERKETDLRGIVPVLTLPWVLLMAYLFLPCFPEPAVYNTRVKECDYPEASGLLFTRSLASISQEVLGPS